MAGRLRDLRAHTNDFTLTAEQYVVVAYAALAALTVIVLTGAAVRLTGSGLGCPTWPKCYGNLYPPGNTHAVIEFSNRVVSVPVVLAAGAAWVGALRRRPYRRELALLGALLPLGVVAQAIMGGLTVKGALDYGWVMGHFALSMLILVVAVTLVWRARAHRRDPAAAPGVGADVAAGAGAGAGGATATARPGGRRLALRAVSGLTLRTGAPGADRTLVLYARGLVLLGAVTLFAGTAATAAGPHAGGSPGQKINRLSFDGRGTMDFVIHRHGEIALAFGLAAVGLWFMARRRDAGAGLRRPLTVLCWLLALQGAVGLDQYETHLPTELVWVHVALASCSWIAVIWAALAAGGLPARSPQGHLERPEEAPERPSEAHLVAASQVELRGN